MAKKDMETPQGVYNDEQAKGFSQKGIPEASFEQANADTSANPMTAAEKETNTQREDKA
jgi:hypothetical protein